MTTVAQLIEILKKFPQDAEVNVLAECSVFYATSTKWIDPCKGLYTENCNVYDGIDLIGGTVYLGEN